MQISKTRRAVLGALTLFVAGAGMARAAKPFPTKPIVIIVPYSAGGVLDVQTRLLAQYMAVELGQPVVVEARAGARANIGAQHVVGAEADGHTLLATTTFVVSNPIVDSATRWKSSDLTPVAGFSQTHSYLLVPADSSVGSVKEFVDLAKRAPQPLPVADGGPGTSYTMCMELLRKAAGIELQNVPYKGAPPALLDLSNGLLAASIFPAIVAYPQIATGRIRAIATIGNTRSPQLPDVPTLAEAGYPSATTLTWFGLHAPAGTPPEVVQRIAASVQTATQASEVNERIVSSGGMVDYMDTGKFAAFLAGESRRWEGLAKDLVLPDQRQG